MRGGDPRSQAWHRVLPKTVVWAVISAIVVLLALSGTFLILNPKYENPRNPVPGGPVLLFTAVTATLLVGGVSLADLVALQYSPSKVAVKLRSGRLVRASWRDVGDCRYYPENKAFSLSFVGRRFGWSARLDEPVGNEVVGLFRETRGR